MNRMKNQMQVSVFLAAVILALATSLAHATVLTVDKTPTQFAFPDPFFGTPSTSVYSDYGDNVTAADLVSGQDVSATHGAGVKFLYGSTWGATPDITVDYIGPVSDSVVTANGMRAYQDPNFPLSFLPVLVDPVNRRLFTLTANTSTSFVGLRGFTLYSPGAVRNVDDLRVVRINADLSETVLYSTGATTVGPSPTVFNFSSAPLEGKIIAIDFDPGSGDQQNNHTWDDIAFAQEIPEPSAMAMLAVAGVLMLRRRR